MLSVQLGCERRFNIEFYGADSHFCHSAYVTWSHVELWSAHEPARLSHFCCRTHFVRRDKRVECSSAAPHRCHLFRLSKSLYSRPVLFKSTNNFLFSKSFDAEFTRPNSRNLSAFLYTIFYSSYHFKFSFDSQNLPPVRHCSHVVSLLVSYWREDGNFTHKVNCRWDLRTSGKLRSADW